MSQYRVRSVALPQQSSLAGQYGRADFSDAFAITLPPGTALDIEPIARAVLGDPVWWFRALLAVRDALVAPFGVLTTGQIRAQMMRAPDTPRIDFFPVMSRSEHELVVGADDAHLDFKTSVLVRATADGHEVVATTVVMFNNRFGRFYIGLIAPFHRLVVRSGLARAARQWQIRAAA